MSNINSLSVVISVSERGDGLPDVLESYIENIAKLDLDFEIIVVLPPEFESLNEYLAGKKENVEKLKVIILNRNYGEAGLIKIGIEYAQFDHILTLPPYEQISPESIGKIVNALEDFDAVVVNRWPRIDHRINRIQSIIFKSFLRIFAYNVPKDPGSGIRLSKKEVLNELKLYGDMHRFFYMLASQLGFRILQLDIPQSRADTHLRVYGFRTYISRFLDILTVGFLTRFNYKPLRFFGAGGAFSAALGFIGMGYIGIERIFFDVPASDRPLLVLSSLFFVLGIQLFAIGLVGETIIFTSSKNNKEYRIRKIIN